MNRIENKYVRKQYYSMIINQIIGYTIFYIVIALVVLSLFYYYYVGRVRSDLRHDAKVLKSSFNIDSELRLSDENFYYICFDENKEVIPDKYSESLLSYYGDDEIDALKAKAINSDLFKLNNKLDKNIGGKQLEVDGKSYNFITYSFEVNSDESGNVKYIKLLVMTNYETRMLRIVGRIYIITSLFVFALSAIYSFAFAKISLKNFIQNYEFQKEAIGELSHSMKTPLAVIQTNLEDVLSRTDSRVIDVSDSVAVSLEQTAKLNKLTKDMLAIASSQASKYYYNFEETDVKKLVYDTSIVFKEMAELTNKKFTLELDEVTSKVDPQKISDCLVILLENALKYTDSGDEIIVKLTRFNDLFVLKIIDTGVGISKKAKKHVFDRFYRENNDSKRCGNGLGLAIAKEIVLNHKGKIEVFDNGPRGTIFQVTIKNKQ